MSGHSEEPAPHPIREKQMTRFVGAVRLEFGASGDAADLFQRSSEAQWIAGELHGRGVGEEFTLPAYCRLDETSKQYADPADYNQAQADDPGQGNDIALPPELEQDASDHSEAEDAEDQAHEAKVEFHISVQKMAELMRDHALEFLAGEHGHRTVGDGDGGVARGMARGERVDPGFAIHYVDLRHRDAGSDRHFLDDIEKLALLDIRRVGINQTAIQHLGHGAAAPGQR